MAKLIIVVTHGKAERDPKGGLTQKGKKQMRKIKAKLSLDEIGYVVSGAAPRQEESCMIITGRRADVVEEKVGVHDVLSLDGKHMILSGGEKIPVKEYIATRFEEIKQRIIPFLKQLFERPEKKILIVGGRIVPIGAGIKPEKAKSGHIYYITLTPSGRIKIGD